MWLEDTALLWVPVVVALVACILWRLIKLGREVRALSERLDRAERAGNTRPPLSETPPAADRARSDRAA